MRINAFVNKITTQTNAECMFEFCELTEKLIF